MQSDFPPINSDETPLDVSYVALPDPEPNSLLHRFLNPSKKDIPLFAISTTATFTMGIWTGLKALQDTPRMLEFGRFYISSFAFVLIGTTSYTISDGLSRYFALSEPSPAPLDNNNTIDNSVLYFVKWFALLPTCLMKAINITASMMDTKDSVPAIIAKEIFGQTVMENGLARIPLQAVSGVIGLLMGISISRAMWKFYNDDLTRYISYTHNEYRTAYQQNHWGKLIGLCTLSLLLGATASRGYGLFYILYYIGLEDTISHDFSLPKDNLLAKTIPIGANLLAVQAGIVNFYASFKVTQDFANNLWRCRPLALCDIKDTDENPMNRNRGGWILTLIGLLNVICTGIVGWILTESNSNTLTLINQYSMISYTLNYLIYSMAKAAKGGNKAWEWAQTTRCGRLFCPVEEMGIPNDTSRENHSTELDITPSTLYNNA